MHNVNKKCKSDDVLDSDLWKQKSRDKSSDPMKTRHVLEKSEIDSITRDFKMSKKQKRAFHKYITDLKEKEDTLECDQLRHVATDFMEQYE